MLTGTHRYTNRLHHSKNSRRRKSFFRQVNRPTNPWNFLPMARHCRRCISTCNLGHRQPRGTGGARTRSTSEPQISQQLLPRKRGNKIVYHALMTSYTLPFVAQVLSKPRARVASQSWCTNTLACQHLCSKFAQGVHVTSSHGLLTSQTSWFSQVVYSAFDRTDWNHLMAPALSRAENIQRLSLPTSARSALHECVAAMRRKSQAASTTLVQVRSSYVCCNLARKHF